MEQLSQIASSAFAGDVRVIGRGHQAHSLCRAGKHIAKRVGKSLDFVRPEADFIVDDVVMSGASSALQPAMRYLRCQWQNLHGHGSVTNLVRRNRNHIWQ